MGHPTASRVTERFDDERAHKRRHGDVREACEGARDGADAWEEGRCVNGTRKHGKKSVESGAHPPTQEAGTSQAVLRRALLRCVHGSAKHKRNAPEMRPSFLTSWKSGQIRSETDTWLTSMAIGNAAFGQCGTGLGARKQVADLGTMASHARAKGREERKVYSKRTRSCKIGVGKAKADGANRPRG